MNTALVTGATGFIGSHLAEALCNRNVRVKCLTRPTSNLRWIRHLDAEIIRADFTDPDTLKDPARDAEYVFHLAGAVKALGWKEYHQSNVLATRNLLSAAEASSRLKRFVLVSSQAAGGPSSDGAPVKESDPPRPLTQYGRSKLEAERIVLDHADRMPVTIVRPPSVFGPRDGEMVRLFRAVRSGMRPALGLRPHYASLIYVEDLVRGILQAAESENSIGKTYFLATEPDMSWERLGRALAEVMKRRTVSVRIPLWAFASVALVRDMIARLTRRPDIVNWDKVKEFRERFWICNSTLAQQDFEFAAHTDLKEALAKTYQWYADHGWF